jgi:hypothetical protein
MADQSHSWSYEGQPRSVTERQCRRCSLECRRPEGQSWSQATHQGALEFRFPEHPWAKPHGYPPCPGPGARIATARAATLRRTGT